MHHIHHHHHGHAGIHVAPAPGSAMAIVGVLIGAVVLIGLAVMFIVLGLSNDLLFTSFMITGGVLGPCGLGMLFLAFGLMSKRANAQRLRVSGIPGQAQIVGLQQTGMYVNYQPVVMMQLQITTAVHQPYVVTHREAVPQIMTGLLTSGRPLPVMVDPARPDNLVILWESALSMPLAGSGQAGIGAGMGGGANPAGYGFPPSG